MKMRYRKNNRKINKKRKTLKIVLLTLAGFILLSGLAVYAILYSYISKINFIDKHVSPYNTGMSPDYSDAESAGNPDEYVVAGSSEADFKPDGKAGNDKAHQSSTISEAAGPDSRYGSGGYDAGYSSAGPGGYGAGYNSYAESSDYNSGYDSQAGKDGYNDVIDYYAYLNREGSGQDNHADYSREGAGFDAGSGTGGHFFMQEAKEAAAGSREGKDMPVLKQEIGRNQDLTGTDDKLPVTGQMLNGIQNQGGNPAAADKGKAMGSKEGETDKDKVENSDAEPAIEPIRDDKVMNLLLIGQDLASKNSSSNESFALFTVNKRSKKLITTSFYNNLYVYIPGVGKERLATAYELGGADLLIKTLEKNFGLVVDGFIMADYSAYIDIVDLIGGVELDISEQELEPVNRNIREINTQLGYSEDADLISSKGKILLNGKQALGYSRNWYTKEGKFISHGNQKAVILSILNEVRSFNIIKINAFLNEILPKITTNLSQSRIMELIVMLPMYFNYSIDYLTLPVKGTETRLMLDGRTVLDYNSEQNLAQIRSILYAMQ